MNDAVLLAKLPSLVHKRVFAYVSSTKICNFYVRTNFLLTLNYCTTNNFSLTNEEVESVFHGFTGSLDKHRIFVFDRFFCIQYF